VKKPSLCPILPNCPTTTDFPTKEKEKKTKKKKGETQTTELPHTTEYIPDLSLQGGEKKGRGERGVKKKGGRRGTVFGHAAYFFRRPPR